uniref:Uncharacterized protein n=2 Tax=Meloidogyne TaxID=189290 RepID=A0A6V7X806_MELEN|nr:unnamed protein product [Meloidogyne enterolobii]
MLVRQSICLQDELFVIQELVIQSPSTRQKQGQHVIVRLRDDRKYTAVSTQTSS